MPRRPNRNSPNSSRRNFLKASGASAVALSLAGCPADKPNREKTDAETGTETTGERTTDTETKRPSENTVGPDDIEPGGTLGYGMDGSPDTANVFLSSKAYSKVALAPVYDYGTAHDPVTFAVEPSVFTDWELKNAGAKKPDGYFNCRKRGLRWNDGKRFSKEDVLFSYQFLLDNEPEQLTVWKHFDTIERANNSWDFHIELSEPLGTWDSDILGAVPIVPKHKWEGVDFREYDPMKENEDGPVGTGPGTLAEWKPDSSMRVEFRRDYVENTYALNDLKWKKQHDSIIHGGPFLDAIDFNVYNNTSQMTRAFLNGKVDTCFGSVDSSTVSDIEDSDDFDLIRGYDSGFSYCGFNCRRTPLDDVALRQAMAFLFDDYYWTQKLHDDFYIKGDYAQSPGYKGTRPETVFGGKLYRDERTNAFDFRSAAGKEPDIEAVRTFLTEGRVLDGSKGTYAGKEFPGAFSDARASQSNAKYEYTFDSVESENLTDAEVDVDKEIRIQGKTIPELMGADGITILIDPPEVQPKTARALNRWKENLQRVGIPTQTEPMSYNTMKAKVFKSEEFDVYPMGWEATNPHGTSLYSFFYSENSGDDSDEFMYNSTGYGVSDGGADRLLEAAKAEPDPAQRAKKYATAMEKIYFDMPYMVQSYTKYRWPVNSNDFGGFVEYVVDPGFTNWDAEYTNIYLKENLKE